MARTKKIGKVHPKSKVTIYNDGTCDAYVSNYDGYMVYQGNRGRGFGMYTLHRHVAELFVPNPHKKPFVNHKDGRKYNNRASNLEWVTPAENAQHAQKMGLVRRKLTEKDVREIRKSKMPSYRICFKYDVSIGTINSVRKRLTWKHIN